MKVRFKTNLDLHHSEVFPTDIPARPIVGDIVFSKKIWKQGTQLKLVVVAVELSETEIIAELHLPKFWQNISDFYMNFYEPLTGSQFI